MVLWAMLSQGRGWEFGIPAAALAMLAGHRLGLQSGALSALRHRSVGTGRACTDDAAQRAAANHGVERHGER